MSLIHRCRYGVLALGLWLSPGARLHAQQAVGATFGDVIQLQGGTPSDIVLDELRHQLYLVSNTTSQVIVFDYTSNQVVARIADREDAAGGRDVDGRHLPVRDRERPSFGALRDRPFAESRWPIRRRCPPRRKAWKPASMAACWSPWWAPA